MSSTIDEEECYGRVLGCLHNLSYGHNGVAIGALRAIDEWAETHGLNLNLTSHHALRTAVAAKQEECAGLADAAAEVWEGGDVHGEDPQIRAVKALVAQTHRSVAKTIRALK